MELPQPCRFNLCMTLLVLYFLISFLSHTRTEAVATYVCHNCPNTTTFTTNSTYQSNLNNLLIYLSSNAIIQGTLLWIQKFSTLTVSDQKSSPWTSETKENEFWKPFCWKHGRWEQITNERDMGLSFLKLWKHFLGKKKKRIFFGDGVVLFLKRHSCVLEDKILKPLDFWVKTEEFKVE